MIVMINTVMPWDITVIVNGISFLKSLLMLITYDSNRHLSTFFNQHSQSEPAIRKDIAERLPRLITQNSPKIKFANPLRFNGFRIHEYKVVADKQLTCRVAYIYEHDTVTIIYISETLIKRQFCQLLGKSGLIS
jgi:hypothetical protein